MDGKSYEIYLTKSHQAAALLRDALEAQRGEKESFVTSWGAANDDPRIPTIYQGWFYALAEYDAPENTRPLYHLTIC